MRHWINIALSLILSGCTTLDYETAARLGAADCNCIARACKEIQFNYTQGAAVNEQKGEYGELRLRRETE